MLLRVYLRDRSFSSLRAVSRFFALAFSYSFSDVFGRAVVVWFCFGFHILCGWSWCSVLSFGLCELFVFYGMLCFVVGDVSCSVGGWYVLA